MPVGLPAQERPLVVETRALTRVYRMGTSDVHALRGVDLQVQRQEFVSIMGRSGSGKSTLLHLLGCLDRPTGGAIWLQGVEVTALPRRSLPAVRRRQVGFMFQEFNLLAELTALENVLLPLRYSGVPARQGRERAELLLERAGLADRLGHRPGELSGGEQQRVALARALINRPAIVLADEPTGEVDTATAVQVVALIRELNHSEAQTFIVVTHDPMVAAATDRTLLLQDGRLVGEERHG
jgi:putative ABC transport system ATP-binding protein